MRFFSHFSKLCVVLAICALVINAFVSSPIFGEEDENQQQKYDEKQKEIFELEQKVMELQEKERNLTEQIAYMDDQIQLTTLRIGNAETKLQELARDIEILGIRIEKISVNLDRLSVLLTERIVATYKSSSLSPAALLFSSSGFSDFVARYKYLRVAQGNDKKLFYQMQQTKASYSNQKDEKENKKVEEEALKMRLESLKVQLDQQKADKQEFLRITQNDEKLYQERLQAAIRELAQIQSAAKVLISTEPQEVKRGETIGLMGNTGYSFGDHLHFGTYNISSLEQYNYYSNHENPSSVLEQKNVNWQTGCGGDSNGLIPTGEGSFAWPMSTDSLYISQGYGITCYSNVYYKGNPHPAYDMYNNSNILVKAVEDGKAYFCRNCTGDGGNGVFIFHSNGKMTLYWHLQ